MTAFYSARTARRTYRCDGDPYPGDCSGQIRPGDRYVKATATPNHDGHGNSDWWMLRYCSACAKFFTQPKAALEAMEDQ